MASNLQPIIVKKKKHGDHAFHGGHWKVALADFMTSMFIIFLLLWLLSQVPPIVRDGIADYFNPQSPSRETSGNNGVLGGQTLASPGAQRSTSAPIGPVGGGPTSPQENEGTTEIPGFPGSKQNARGFDGDVVGRGSGADGRNGQFDGMRGPGTGIGPGPGPSSFPPGRPGDAAIMQANGELALKLGQEISMAIQKSPELNGLQQNVIIEPSIEGVRIQLVDNDKRDMFPRGTAQALPQTQQLMAQVAKIVAPLAEKLSISGHTDGLQFGKAATYTNWELSADRANAARRLLVGNGVAEDRMTTVIGKADKEHLFPDQPNAPQNRRISITLLTQPGAGGPASQVAAPAAAPAPAAPAPAAAAIAPAPPAPAPRAVVSTTPSAGPAPDGRLLPIQR